MNIDEALQYVKQTAHGAHAGPGWSEGADNNALRVLAAEVERLRAEQKLDGAEIERLQRELGNLRDGLSITNTQEQKAACDARYFEREVGQMSAEIERLRAANAELRAAGEDAVNRLERCHDDADRYQARALKAEAENAALKENASATLYHEALRMKKLLAWFERRQVLSDELQTVHSALCASLSGSYDEIVNATGALFDFDLTKPGACE